MVKKLTQKQYVAEGGSICPVCRGADIVADHPEIDGAQVWVNVECPCGAYWTDVYELTGYDNLNEGKE